MAIFQTFQAVGNREDLTDIIANVSPTDTKMLSSFGRTTANAVLHEWQSDSLASATATGDVEGADSPTFTAVATTRLSNSTQIQSRPFQVSNTQQAVKHAGRGDEYAYHAAKAMKELARNMEKAIHDGTGNTGASGTARELKGVRTIISTNTQTGTATGNTTPLTVTRLNTMLATVWAAGGQPNAIYVGSAQKQAIGAFTTPITRYQETSTKTFTPVVNVYDSDFGPLQIKLDRYATASELLALQEDSFKVAYLRPVETKPLPDLGGGPRGKVEVEYTLEYGNELSHGKMTNLS